MKTQVSLIASSVRHQLYKDFFDSLEGTSVKYEVVFAGNKLPPIQYPVNYILTHNIKPAQCYEIARCAAIGETVLWCADDCEFPNNVIGKAYDYWKSQDNEKLILSIQTKESGYRLPQGKLFPMQNHTLLANDPKTPLMAPLALISRKFLEDLGGFDRRYICGQYENSSVMDAYAVGGTVEIFGGTDCFIDLDHLGKSIKIGECKDENSFLMRPFATGYRNDREVLLKSWCNWKYVPRQYFKDGKSCFTTFFFEEACLNVDDVVKKRADKFEPYEDKDILTKSQKPKGQWE